MQLHYFVPFKAAPSVSAQLALKEKLVNIEGVAVDTSVNANKWQVPAEDLDAVAQNLVGAQLRVDHAESALMVVGKVSEAKREGYHVLFRAEVGEERLIEKILRGYVTHVSIQVDSDEVDCSKCKRPTRREGMLVHLCPGAWEIVHRPKVRELSIVASPAYRDTAFSPVGFAAAMNQNQWTAILRGVEDSGLSRDNREVKYTSETVFQQDASPNKTRENMQETDPKQIQYDDIIVQLEQLSNRIRQEPAGGDAELETLKQQVAELEAEIGKRTAKRQLSRKISELNQRLENQDQQGEPAQSEAKRASGRGIVALDEAQTRALGSQSWFKDLQKANQKLTGFR